MAIQLATGQSKCYFDSEELAQYGSFVPGEVREDIPPEIEKKLLGLKTVVFERPPARKAVTAPEAEGGN